MASYNEQIVRAWDEWLTDIGAASADPGDFVDWAVANNKLVPSPQDVKQLLRRQVTQALRQSKRYDENGGFYYRTYQSVTLFENGHAVKQYFDTDSGGTPTLRQKSVKQRRDAIADHVYRAYCDVERMNSVHRDEPRLNFVTDFTDDVAELRIADSFDKAEDDIAL